jgi:hypothetical protein
MVKVVIVLDFIPILIKGELRMVNAFLMPFSAAIKQPALIIQQVPIDHLSVNDVTEVKSEHLSHDLVVVVGDWDHIIEMDYLLTDLVSLSYPADSQVLDLQGPRMR